jgi:lycopene cyclase domain-containing protein
MFTGRAIAVLAPFLYVPLFIFLPILLLDTDYGWSVVILFWIPSAILYLVLHRWMAGRFLGAFWLTCAVLLPVTAAFEYLCLYLDIWDFYEGVQSLWGPRILGAPIEEFIFWFGATPFCLLVYLYYYRLFGKKEA